MQCNGLSAEELGKRGRKTKIVCCWCMLTRIKRGDGYFGGVIDSKSGCIVIMGQFEPGMCVYSMCVYSICVHIFADCKSIFFL